ncbi:MAG: oxygenase MpaB family protein [Polyangiales bacterium]
MSESFPSRYCNREQARREFGADADRYASYYLMGDPIADDLAAWLHRGGERAKTQLEGALERGLSSVPNPPPELRGFFERAESIPSWVDFAELRQGALAYQRFGILGMIVLSAWSLINGYHSSAAVKPLAFTGQLRHNAQRRLAETARFVSEASQVDGLRRGRPGYEISLRVALIHAHVRSACARSPGWRTEDWGVPINQADMLGTLLEFSLLMLDGAQRLGFHVDPSERKAILAMWRYAGHLSGVDPWLLNHLRSEVETRRIAELIRLVQPGPDEDSLALTRQLLKVPEQNARGAGPGVLGVAVSRFHNGLARALNGPEIADNLGIPNDLWKYSEYPVRAVLTPLERLRRVIPGASALVAHTNNTIIRRDLERILRGAQAEFDVA